MSLKPFSGKERTHRTPEQINLFIASEVEAYIREALARGELGVHPATREDCAGALITDHKRLAKDMTARRLRYRQMGWIKRALSRWLGWV